MSLVPPVNCPIHQPTHRFDLLFGHQFPECTAAQAKKTRIMVSPNIAEQLNNKSPCDYAAMKHFFASMLWQTTLAGPLKADIGTNVEAQLAVMREVAASVVDDDASASVDGALPYIGVHLRHKWEFKLTPPRVSDVADTLRAVVTQLNPQAHTEVADAAPRPNNARYPMWGKHPVVFCASDEVCVCVCVCVCVLSLIHI